MGYGARFNCTMVSIWIALGLRQVLIIIIQYCRSSGISYGYASVYFNVTIDWEYAKMHPHLFSNDFLLVASSRLLPPTWLGRASNSFSCYFVGNSF